MTTLARKLFPLLLILTLGFPAPRPESAAAAPAPQQIIDFDLLAEGSGWVLLDRELYWTSDSGGAWEAIGPEVPPEAAVQAVSFLDASSGWLLWTQIDAPGSLLYTLARTIDGGGSWQTAPLPLFEAGEAAALLERADMGWLDAQHGWIAVKQATGSNFSLGTLFVTSDGGSSWRRSALPVADEVTFSDPLTGWALGGPTGGDIFFTQDGGLTWVDARPASAPEGAIVQAPFYADGAATLVTTEVDPQGGLTLRVLRGAPGDFQPAGEATLDAQPGLIPLSIPGAGSLTALIPGTDSVVLMRDGTLEVLTSPGEDSAFITALDMLTPDNGWARSVNSRCSSAEGEEPVTLSCTVVSRLLQTADGGLTWEPLPLPGAGLEAGVEALTLSTTVQSLPNLGNTEVMIGQGFDKCEIPTLLQMQIWRDASPYRAVNLYIGGSSRACSNAALTATYLDQLNYMGWKFIPTWVGPQAPCTGYSSRMSSDPAVSYTQGVAEANLAVDRLAALGLTYPDKTGSIVYYDIEYYGTDTACRQAVNSFMEGWTARLHALGSLSGIYGSTLCSTGLSDFRTLANQPDAVWPARWYNNAGQGAYDPAASVWNLGACLPNTAWNDHQRIRQYEGDHFETWGGLTLGIDNDVLDGVVAVPYLDPANISFQQVAMGLTSPLGITAAGDGSGRLFILERPGRIRILKNGSLLTSPFLDIAPLIRSTGSEQGLLALAFHPSFETNRKFYVAYTAPRPGDSVGSVLTLRQYLASAGDPDTADPASGATILTIDHPTYSNHNGGTLAFGSDGYLYWSVGDGGGGGDPGDNAQNLSSLLGKILRLNVDSGSPYSIPTTNPFYNNPNSAIRKEIWAYGLRNPWRMSFDPATHDLYIGDVGQGELEEIDFQPASSGGGENYGWDVMEGSQCYPSGSACNKTGKVLPVAEYSHSLGCSVTGGHVYRGPSSPSLTGHYLYGDYCSGRIWSIYRNAPDSWSAPIQLADTAYSISSFGQDELGELYVADYQNGRIYKIRYQEPNQTINGTTVLAGVTLSYFDGTAKTVTSAANGGYTITVPSGWSGTVTPSRTGFTFTPASRTYSNLNRTLLNQNFTPSFVGGVTVTSNRDVVTVGRPHVGAEVASYGGFTGGGTNAYIPMLFKGAFGGSYNAAFYIQNVHSSSTASITIRYYDSSGNLNCTKADSIAPLASKGYWLPTVTCDTGSLPAGWVGGVTVASDQPIVTVGRPHVGAQVMTYDGFSGGSPSAYIPMLFKSAFGGSYNSAFYIQNVHASNTAAVTIRYYDSDGVLNCTKADSIAPLASKGYWLLSETCDTGSLPSGWVGGVVVTSDQPVAAVGRPHIGPEITSYNGFTGGGSTAYVPMLFKGAFGGSYNAAFYLQNVHTSNTAAVTLKYYDSDGVLNCTKTDSVPPLASKGYWLPSETCDTGSLPAGWVGGVVVTSSQPLVAVGRPHIADQITAYDGFTAGGANAYVPMLFRDAFGGGYDSALYVQNVDPSGPANVTIRLYDSDGALACTVNDTLAALASKGYWLPALACPP